MELLDELIKHLSGLNARWYLCGGLAIDVYLGRKTRKHKDIDITINYSGMEEVLRYLKNKEWEICAPVGRQRLVSVEYAIEHPELHFNNIWCYKSGSEFIKTEKIDGVYRYCNYVREEQTTFDFLEVLFNHFDTRTFYYKRNKDIVRDIDKAFIKKKNIEILAPEIVLLYKSTNYHNHDNENDFREVIGSLDSERYDWFYRAMKIAYPDGHCWIK